MRLDNRVGMSQKLSWRRFAISVNSGWCPEKNPGTKKVSGFHIAGASSVREQLEAIQKKLLGNNGRQRHDFRYVRLDAFVA